MNSHVLNKMKSLVSSSNNITFLTVWTSSRNREGANIIMSRMTSPLKLIPCMVVFFLLKEGEKHFYEQLLQLMCFHRIEGDAGQLGLFIESNSK